MNLAAALCDQKDRRGIPTAKKIRERRDKQEQRPGRKGSARDPLETDPKQEIEKETWDESISTSMHRACKREKSKWWSERNRIKRNKKRRFPQSRNLLYVEPRERESVMAASILRDATHIGDHNQTRGREAPPKENAAANKGKKPAH